MKDLVFRELVKDIIVYENKNVHNFGFSSFSHEVQKSKKSEKLTRIYEFRQGVNLPRFSVDRCGKKIFIFCYKYDEIPFDKIRKTLNGRKISRHFRKHNIELKDIMLHVVNFYPSK